MPMKMNLYIITAAILVLPVGMAVYKLVKAQRKKKAWLTLAKAYERLVLESRLSVEHSEILGGKVIALDRRNKKLLLVDHSGPQPLERCIPLRDVTATRIVEMRDDLQQCIRRIVLELRCKQAEAPVQFCFYDEQQDPLTDLKTLVRKSQQWKTRIDVHRNPGNVNMQMEYVL